MVKFVGVDGVGGGGGGGLGEWNTSPAKYYMTLGLFFIKWDQMISEEPEVES